MIVVINEGTADRIPAKDNNQVRRRLEITVRLKFKQINSFRCRILFCFTGRALNREDTSLKFPLLKK
jgi:hypothetical protein